uniref:Uncharacterized protein n=1 Tax=Panagrolaimus sp. ES5 TaxID=591445 RepID=A0AC34G951_9BILA
METEEFQKLGAVLPISRAISEQHIDKTTIVRLAASYIRLHHLLGFRQHPHFPQQQQNGAINFGVAGFENEDLITPCLIDIIDGFMIILNENGEILYVSETISLHLGLSQVEMIGNLFSNYFHSDDIESFERFLKATLYTKESNTETFRVKSTLTKRSSKDLHNPNAGFRPLQITITPCSTSVSTGNFYVAGYCQPHLVGPGITIRLNNENFVITTDLTFNIIYIDPHVTKIFNLKQQNSTTSTSNPAVASSSELNENWQKGVSFYSIIFPEDVYIAQEMHQNLFKFHSYKSPLIQLISNDNYSTFNVEIFAITYSSVNAHGNSQKITGEHFVFICTYIG